MPASLQAARDVLLQACLALQQRGAAATPALLSALRLVHSYLLVRILVRQGDHLAAARLLLVVAVSSVQGAVLLVAAVDRRLLPAALAPCRYAAARHYVLSAVYLHLSMLHDVLCSLQEGINAFPKHVLPILTSAVIECHRAALHGPAQVGGSWRHCYLGTLCHARHSVEAVLRLA